MGVVNVKVAYIRPLGYDNLEQWMSDPQNVYIGRGGVVFINKRRYPPQASIWANPFRIGVDGTREQVLDKYREYIQQQLQTGAITSTQLEALRGKRLAYF
ncbi:hypothetical protein BG015_010579 [Linnemannia schmuckeri]|uniref:DUF4326 domain-containing protein n=1 Tax=Linnemannia schmuckeri TaxID=64567 RepID=A0A9P5RTU5_9FUNG|nr:hypothetical protein BG015_010579 [Linnemannia schmuckeri]